jgi:hypothetical protein
LPLGRKSFTASESSEEKEPRGKIMPLAENWTLSGLDEGNCGFPEADVVEVERPDAECGRMRERVGDVVPVDVRMLVEEDFCSIIVVNGVP